MDAQDRNGIEHLIYEYARRMDDGDWVGVGALFEHGAICDEEGTELARGATAVTDLYEATSRRHADGTPLTHHVTTNVDVSVEGDAATARSYFTVFQATDAVPLQPVITGRYRDRFARDEDGSWHFAERRMVLGLTGNLSDHLLIDLPD